MTKNKEGNVVLNDQNWKCISAEARDLVSKMVVKDPANRITAKDALMHPWFNIDHSGSCALSNAQENMKKYNDKNRFNMEKMKPEFSMVMCTPLLNSRFAGAQNSPLQTGNGGNRNPFLGKSPMLSSKPLHGEQKEEDGKVCEHKIN